VSTSEEISTLVVSRGIKELRSVYESIFNNVKDYSIKVEIIFTYLGITLLTGTIILTVSLIPLLIQYDFVFSGYLIFAGIFYLGVSGAAFITSLWPILSLLIGYLLFSSSPDYLRYKKHIKWLFLVAVILLVASIISIF